MPPSSAVPGRGEEPDEPIEATVNLRGQQHRLPGTQESPAAARQLQRLFAEEDSLERTLRSLREGENPEHPTLTVDGQTFRLLRRLGSGGLGSAFLVEPPERPGERYVLKVVTAEVRDPRVEPILASMEQETAALDAIGELEAAQTVESPLKRHRVIVMRYHPGQSLASLMEKEPGGLPPTRACRVVLDVARELKRHADESHLLHHDIKSLNVIVSDTTGRASLIDWGASTFIDTDRDAPHPVSQVTPAAADAGQLEGNGSMPSQVFCLGLMLLRLLAGRHGNPLAAAGVQTKDGADGGARAILDALGHQHPQNVRDGSGLYGLLNVGPDGGDSYLRRVTDWGHQRDIGWRLHSAFSRILHIDRTARMSIEDLITTLTGIIQDLERAQ